jgi:hypothetical protein
MDKGIHVARFLGRHIVFDVEAFDFAGKARGEVRGIELRDLGDTRLASDQIGPAVGNGIANRRNQPKACNNNTTTAHGNPLSINDKKQKPQDPQEIAL